MSLIKCPDCSRLISTIFPLHNCTPCANHTPKKTKGLSVREANKILQRGTIAILGITNEITNTKIRIIRARERKGKLQGLQLTSGKWTDILRLESE